MTQYGGGLAPAFFVQIRICQNDNLNTTQKEAHTTVNLLFYPLYKS